MEYEFKPDKDTVSFTGPVDPREILVEDDDQADKAWLFAAAYAWATDEDEDE